MFQIGEKKNRIYLEFVEALMPLKFVYKIYKNTGR